MKLGSSKLENKAEILKKQAFLLKNKDRSDELKMNKNLSSLDIKNLLDKNLKNKMNQSNVFKKNSSDCININDYNSLPLNLKVSTITDDLDINEEFEEDIDEEMKELNKIVKKLDFDNIRHNDNSIFEKNHYKKISTTMNVDNFFDFLFCSKKE